MVIADREYFVILPKYSNSDERGARQRISIRALERYARDMADQFGGVTVHPSVLGCARSPEGELACEEVIKLLSNRDFETTKGRPETILNHDRRFMRELAETAAEEFGQWSVITSEDTHSDVHFSRNFRAERVRPGLQASASEVFARLLSN